MLLPTKEFYNKHANYYDKGIDSFESINENKLRSELIRKFIPNHSKVLDLGCGSGFGYKILRDIVDKYIGIDISIGLLKIACTKFRNDVINEKANFEYGDLEEKINYPNEYFDSVISFYGSCSHLVKENSMEKLTSEILRVLKPDSYAIIDLLSKYSLDRLLHSSYNIHSCSLNWIKTTDKTVARLYTPSSARKLFKNSGFEIEKIIGVTILADRGLPFRKIFDKHRRLGQIEFNMEKIINSYFPFNGLAHALIIVAYKD